MVNAERGPGTKTERLEQANEFEKTLGMELGKAAAFGLDSKAIGKWSRREI